jgi:hypothetical protein
MRPQLEKISTQAQSKDSQTTAEAVNATVMETDTDIPPAEGNTCTADDGIIQPIKLPPDL